MGHSSRKKLGQHFLVDKTIVDKIVNACSFKSDDNILEIGAGKGVLTKVLSNTDCNITSVELDDRLYRYLLNDKALAAKVNIVKANILLYELGNLKSPFHVVANLPYSIATLILMKLIAHKEHINQMVLMFQKEVADRIVASPSDSAYSTLSLFANYHLQSEFLFTVPCVAFDPPPKVDSAVLKLTPRKNMEHHIDDEDQFFEFVKSLFAYRRKSLANNLKQMGGEPAQIESLLQKLKFKPNVRAQNLGLESLITIYKEASYLIKDRSER